ncbi:MAG TPA: ribosome assembly RNA-binding protein YhbY [Methylococcaceae bacterium]|nr:ribosome assembly RNA-binding protein YhbY [Methylococcaceae bacterium]
MTPRLKKALRARAHALKPVVLTGQAGLSEAVLAEIDLALEHHELIKVRLRAEREERTVMAEEICARLGAELVQSLGQIVTLYRKSPEKR